MNVERETRLRRDQVLVGAGALIFVIVWLAPPLNFLRGMHLMPLWLHTLIELSSIVAAFMVFGVVWNAYRAERSGNIILLACAFLAAGLIDFLHLLSYKGMPDFAGAASAAKAINFWLAARLIVAMALFAIAVRPWTSFGKRQTQGRLLAASLAYAVAVMVVGLYFPEWLPTTFAEGQGLTAFKIGSEYFIVALMTVSAAVFYRLAARSDRHDAANLAAATVLTILSELCFTLYSNVFDLMNLLGHCYKVLAYFLFYRAVFVSSVREPFELLHAEVKHGHRLEQALSASKKDLAELSDFLQRVREEERRHFSRELHDELGQSLTALRMDIDWLSENISGRDPAVDARLGTTRQLLAATVDSVRRICEDLRPGMLDDLGLEAALENHAQKFAAQSGISCTLAMDRGDYGLGEQASTALFRIFQETLTNVARHAEASMVEAVLEDQGDAVVLRIADNGKGMANVESTVDRFGLLGMRERARMLGGTFAIAGSAGQGTRIEVCIPYANQARDP